MKRVVSLALMALILCLALTGCMHNDVGIVLNKDGTGSICATLGFEEDFYEDLVDEGNDPFEGKETFTYEYGDETYVGYKETKEFSSFEDMQKTLLDMKYETEYLQTEEDSDSESEDMPIFKNVEIKKDSGLFKNNYSFRAELNEQESEGDAEMYDFNEIFKVSISVEMPGKITEYKGGELNENKVVYEIKDLAESNELYVASQASNTAAVVAVIAVAVIILAVGIIAAIKSKKN